MKDIKDNLSILSIGLLVISILRLMLYYNVFDITILDYIDLGEAVTLSFSSYLPTLGILFPVGMMLYFAQNSEVFTKHNPARFKVIQEPETFGKRFRLFVADTGKFLALAPLLVLISSIVLYFIDKELSHRFFYLSLFLTVWVYYNLLLLEISRKHKQNTGEYPSHVSMNIAKTVIFTSLITFSTAVIDASRLKDNPEFDKVVVGMGNKIVKTTSTYRYVGKTKSYIFFYNKTNRSYNAYNLSKVDSLSVNNQSFDVNGKPLVNKHPTDVLPVQTKVIQPPITNESRPIISRDSLHKGK